MCSRAQHSDWSLRVRHLLRCLSLTDHSRDGAVTCCDGQRALQMRPFDSLRMAHGQALSLYGRLTALDSGTRTPLPAVVFRLAASVPGTWAHWCQSLLIYHSCWLPEFSGVGPGSNPSAVRRWFARGVAPALDRAWSHWPIGGLSALHPVRSNVSSSRFSLDDAIYGPCINHADARWWGLARHGDDPCPGGRTSRHRGDPLGRWSGAKQQASTCAISFNGRLTRV